MSFLEFMSYAAIVVAIGCLVYAVFSLADSRGTAGDKTAGFLGILLVVVPSILIYMIPLGYVGNHWLLTALMWVGVVTYIPGKLYGLYKAFEKDTIERFVVGTVIGLPSLYVVLSVLGLI